MRCTVGVAMGVRRRGGDAVSRRDEAECAENATYNVGQLVSALGIPRSTLLYYESLGIVSPHHDESSGYRSYNNEDVYRLMSCVMLKNLGVSPKDIDDLLDDEPFSAQHFDRYIDMAHRKVAYHQAQVENLVELRTMVENLGKVWIEEVEPYYICFDETQTGYRDYPSNEALDLLLENLPVSGLGARFQDDFFDISLPARWGRTVAVRLAHLVPGLPEGLDVIGGCRCVCTFHHKDDTMRLSSVSSTSRWRIRAYLEDHGLKVAGNAFVPYLFFTGKGCCIKICLPIEPLD